MSEVNSQRLCIYNIKVCNKELFLINLILIVVLLGHSRTIMGVEVHRDGTIILLVLDPSHSPMQMNQINDSSAGCAAMRLLRKSEAAMKARQYQVVAVVGMIDSDQQYQVIPFLQ